MILGLQKFLVTEQPLSTGAMAVFKYSESLEERLKFTSRYSETKNDVSLSVRDGSYLHVPRNLAPMGLVDARTLNPIPAINCKFPPISDEQADCIAKSIAYLKDGQNHVLEAPTGWGKTYGGSAVAVGLGQTTLIVVPKNDLMDAWKETLLNLIGIPENRIGIIQQNKCEYEGKWFVLAMVHSLVSDPSKYPEAIRKYFGTVLFDETHKMAADTFQLAAHMFYAKYRLGLSATPNRPDGKDPVILANIGPTLVRGKQVPMRPKVLVVKTGWKIPRWKRWNVEKQDYEQVVMPHAPGRMAGVFKRMAADKKRQAIIDKFVAQSYAKGRRVLVLADTLDHLKAMHLSISQNGKIPGEKFGYYVGGKKAAELKHAASMPVILGTFAMVAEGTNYPDWDTLVMANPRAKVKQAIGRVMRFKADKMEPVILDLLDDEPIFAGFYSSREVEYYSVKATIVKL